MLRMVKEWAEEDDHILTSSRLAMLDKEGNSLKLGTDGYQWLRQNKCWAEKILKINPDGKYAVLEEFCWAKLTIFGLWTVVLTSQEIY